MTKALIRLFVKNPDDTTSAASRNSYGKLSGYTGIACNAVLFAIKLIAGLISGSISIISDAFNNLADMASSVVTLLGFKLASKPADKEHPFGHGRMEYMSGFIVSALIIFVGFQLVKSSVEGIINPTPIKFSVVSVVIIVASILIKIWMYFFNRYVGKTISSKTIMATAQDSLNDTIATTSVLISTFISIFSPVNIDPYIGIVVSAFIIVGGFKFANEMLSQLLGEPPTEEFVADLKQRIMQSEMFCGMHDLIVHDYGPGRCFVSVHIEVPADADMIKCHEDIDECEKRVGQELNITLVIHMDPIDRGEETLLLRDKISTVVTNIDPVLSIHDFRIVNGEKCINLIFDVVVPYTVDTEISVIENAIQEGASMLDSRYNCVIQFDRSYN